MAWYVGPGTWPGMQGQVHGLVCRARYKLAWYVGPGTWPGMQLPRTCMSILMVV